MFAKSLFNRHLFNEMRSSRVFVDGEQGVADVYTCCSLGGRTEGNVASQTFVIAVKAGTYQFSFGIEHWAAGVSTGIVCVDNEADGHFAVRHGITSEILCLIQLFQFGGDYSYLEIDETATVTASVDDLAGDSYQLKWSVLNSDVATIEGVENNAAVITPAAVGKTVIKVETADGKLCYFSDLNKQMEWRKTHGRPLIGKLSGSIIKFHAWRRNGTSEGTADSKTGSER